MIHRNFTRSSGPAVEPVSTDEIKQHSRITTPADNTYVDNLVKAARVACETYTRRTFIDSTWELRMDRFPGAGCLIDLLYGPVTAVSSIAYIDSNGDSQTWAASSYQSDLNSDVGRVMPAYGEVYPTIRSQLNAVTVTYTAGYGAAGSDVPEAIRQAVMMLAAHWYEHREPVAVGVSLSAVPLTIERLLSPYVIPEV